MSGADSVEIVDVAMELAAIFSRPCVDCGVPTGSTCEFCIVSGCMPGEEGETGQTRPLCIKCENEKGACHFCRKHVCGAPPLAKPKASPTAGGAAGAAMACAAGGAVGSTAECAVIEIIGSVVGSAVGCAVGEAVGSAVSGAAGSARVGAVGDRKNGQVEEWILELWCTLKHSDAIEHTPVQRCCRAHANNCIASELLPGEEWEKGQMTPL